MIKTVKRTNNTIAYGPAWYDQQCTQHKKAMNKSLRNFRKISLDAGSYNDVRHTYIQNKRAYSNLLVAKKTRHYAILESRLSNAKYPGNFFQALRCYRPKYQNRCC
jgi:hypothetical protein